MIAATSESRSEGVVEEVHLVLQAVALAEEGVGGVSSGGWDGQGVGVLAEARHPQGLLLRSRVAVWWQAVFSGRLSTADAAAC
jgi:hypothetical protein